MWYSLGRMEKAHQNRSRTRVTLGPIKVFVNKNEDRQSVWEQVARDAIDFVLVDILEMQK